MMASAGLLWRWGSILYWANIGVLIGDFPAAVSGASKREVMFGLMFWGFMFGLLLAGLRSVARGDESANPID